VTLGAARTPFQDVGFALQQLVEIAVRGLASGTNDPYTAVSALDLSATALVPLWAERQAITAYLDEDALVRVLPHWPAPEQLVDTVFDGVLVVGWMAPRGRDQPRGPSHAGGVDLPRRDEHACPASSAAHRRGRSVIERAHPLRVLENVIAGCRTYWPRLVDGRSGPEARRRVPGDGSS